MATLPSKRPVGTPRAKAPRSIDSSDVGSVPVASAPSVSTPNLGAGLGQAVSNVGNAIQDRENRRLAAQARIDKQNNVIEKARSLRDLQAQLAKERQSAEDTLDLSLQEDVNTTSQRMFDILEESKSNFRGTPDGLAEYIAEAENALGGALDEVNIKSVKLRRGLVRTEIKRNIDDKLLEVQNNPDLLPEAIKDLTGENGLISSMADSLGIEEEQKFTSQAQQDLTNASISANLRLMTVESLDKVAALLDNPDAQAALGPEQLDKARDRLVKFRNALEEDKGDQTPAEEKAELFSKAVQLAKENPDRADSIFKGFGFEDVDQSKVGEALDDLKALNERRKEQGREPLTVEQEDAFISQAVGGVSSIAKDGILVDAFGKTIVTNKSIPEDQENDNVKGGKLTVKAVSEIRRQSTALVGIPTGTQGEIIGNPSREKMDLNARAQSEIGQFVLQGHNIPAAVQLWRSQQKEGTFQDDVTFAQIGANIKEVYLGPDERVGEISSDQAKQTIEEVNADIAKIDLEDATGVTSAMVAAWNSIAGNVSSSLVDPETARARTEFALAYRNVVQLFALNPRFAIAEQEVLKGMIPGPGVLNDPESARQRLSLLDSFIDKKISLNEQLVQTGTGAGTELHKNALKDLADLYQMKSHTRKFNIASGGSSVTQFGSPEEIEKANQSDVRKFLNSKTRKELKEIELQQPELFDALEKKMSGEKTEPKKTEPNKPTVEDEVQKATIQEVEEGIADLNSRLESKDFSEIPEERVRELLKVLQDDLSRRNKKKSPVSAPRPAEATSSSAVEGPESNPQAPLGVRQDGTPKGQGFLGPRERPDGGVSTEISVGVEFDGKEVEIPTMVPTLEPKEIEELLAIDLDQKGAVAKIPEPIMKKAVAHAKARIAEGKSPFLELDEEPLAKPQLPQSRRDVSQTPDIKPRETPETGKKVAKKDTFNDAEAVSALDDEAFERFISTTPASRRSANVNKVVSERLKRNVVKPADKKRIDFISKHEGFTLKAEEIKIGKGKTDKTLTVGGGITAKVFKELTGKTLKEGDSITKEESTRVVKLFIEKEIDPELDKINKSFQLNENQKIALSSLLFNIGVGNLWKGSNARKALIKGDIEEFIQQAFSKEKGFVKSNGIVVNGLVKRRKDEKELFLKKGK